MKSLNCPGCGASLPRNTITTDLVVCEFCGTTFHISKKLVAKPGVGGLLLDADFGNKALPGWELVNEGKLDFHRGTPSELHGFYGPRVNSYDVLKSQGSFDDFDAGVNFRFTEGNEKLIMAGLYPRFTLGGGYAVYISPLGLYDIGYLAKDKNNEWKWEIIMDWTEHAAIQKGMNKNNHLRVVCDGERILVYLNGVLGTSFKDNRSRMGRLHVVVEPNGETNLGIALSDLQVREVAR
jgi:hypothetical protein